MTIYPVKSAKGGAAKPQFTLLNPPKAVRQSRNLTG